MWAQWAPQILLAVVGLSAGIAAAGGLFAFIVELGVVADFADRTHTGDKILTYETSVALGGILGNLFYVFQRSVPAAMEWMSEAAQLSAGRGLLGIFGIFAGIFVGCWSMALAEILNVFPDCEIYSGLYHKCGDWERNRSRTFLFPGMVADAQCIKKSSAGRRAAFFIELL